MKKRFLEAKPIFSKAMFSFLSIMLCSTGLVSCGDDDGDDTGGGGSGGEANSVVIPSLNTNDGQKVRVAQAGEYSYFYNSDGSLASYNDGDITFTATYNPFVLTSSATDGDFSENNTYSNIKLNSQGYVTGMSVAQIYKGSDYEDNITGSVSFTYNGNGNLTKFVAKGKGYEIEDGHKYNVSSTSTMNYTWSNGNLVQIDYSIEGGDNESGTIKYTYAADAKQNVTLQYVPAFVSDDISGMPDFQYIGLLGKGPSQLPTSYTHSYTDDEGHYHSSSKTCTYVLNSDGTVKSFTGMDRGNMSYISVGSSSSNLKQ